MKNRSAFAPLIFLLQTAACQVLAAATVMVVWQVTDKIAVSIILGSITAYAIAIFLSMPTPWQILNLAVPSLCSALLIAPLPQWVPVLLLAITALIHAPAFWTRVPYYPTSKATYALLLAELPADKPFSFVDIGCGFGDLLFTLSKHRPLGHFTGIEIGVLSYTVARFRSLFARGRVTIRFQSMWRISLSKYDVVYTFLSPAPMERLWRKAQDEMRPGTFFITNSFQVPAKPEHTVEVRDTRNSALFFHRI